MSPLHRLGRYLKDEVWRPDDTKIHVRKRRPGFGWTINFHALREKLRRR
jgi:hypothetical protein